MRVLATIGTALAWIGIVAMGLSILVFILWFGAYGIVNGNAEVGDAVERVWVALVGVTIVGFALTATGAVVCVVADR